MKEPLYFPIFMNLTKKHILIIGAGTIAERRIKAIADYTDNLTVIAPSIAPQIREFAKIYTNIVVIERAFSFDDLHGKDIVIAATNNHQLNEEVAKECHKLGILVNVVHDKKLCDFYFPGLVRNDSIVVGVTACGKNHTAVKEVTSQIRDLLNNKEKRKKRILLVSFGSSFKEARQKNIDVIALAIQKRFPNYELHQCFTSQMIIRIVEQKEGIHIYSLNEALEKATEDKVQELLIQPTHVLHGTEYQKIIDSLQELRDQFEVLRIGTPLLSSEHDYMEVAHCMSAHTKEFIDGRTAVVLVGHGTKSEADNAYRHLQAVFEREASTDYYVGTIESSPSKEDIVRVLLKKDKYTRVVLVPFIVVIGEHARSDIFGIKNSWKASLEEAGFEVIPIIKGLSQYSEVREIYVDHLDPNISKKISYEK